MNNKVIVAIALGALVLGGVIGFVVKTPSVENSLGGMKPIGNEYSFNEGIAVDGSTVIDSTGNWVGTGSISAGDITSAGDVVVDDGNTTSTISVGNTGVGKLCLWNGTQFSVMSFSAGSTTASIATSTSCQ